LGAFSAAVLLAGALLLFALKRPPDAAALLWNAFDASGRGWTEQGVIVLVHSPGYLERPKVTSRVRLQRLPWRTH
jgi:hypothetical protein